MNKYLVYSILSGLLLIAGWPSHGFPLFLFFGFVPLLIAEHQISHKSQYKKKTIKVFGLSYITFFIWNAVVIWWLHYAQQYDTNGNLYDSWIAYLPAVFLNSLFMSIVFQLYHLVKTNAGNLYGLIFLPAIWICFENLHLSWDFAWPWFNLGNGFAKYYKWVQWYEITGSFGGTLWVMSTNLIIFYYITAYINRRDKTYIKRLCIYGCLIISFPITISYFRYYTYKDQGESINMLIIQPNLDPYHEKYSKDGLQIYEDIKELAIKNIRPETQFIIAPETAIPGSSFIIYDKIYQDLIIQNIQSLINTKKDLTFLTGASVLRLYPMKSLASETASLMPDGITWYDSFNSAVQIQNDDAIEIYHKSKLVVGVENFPYRKHLMPLFGEMMLNFGGTTNTLGTQAERTVFRNKTNSAVIAPIICYESIFGDYVTDYVKKGANVLCTMTNDSWWGNTDGHRQLFLYGNLRAIENRRSIVRSANSGISAFINQKGDILKSLPYGTKDAINGVVLMNKELTFYTKYGDYIARISLLISGMILTFALAKKFIHKSLRVKNKK